ncbi:MAG: tetratricopeptide repeat protein [Gammaproteobacteria bacterium]|nr:tetratricopeptide repeat protein [Gammaproteobacteria bacterium]
MDDSAVIAQLERILASPQFADAPRQQRLLRYLVECSLAGETERLKGYTLGVDVFDRPADFDPSLDAIVRVEAGRLRTKLRDYYAGPGMADALQFVLPKGGYVMRFEANAAPAAAVTVPANSIAVLPVVSLSPDPAQVCLADGMTDAIINHLGRNPALRVTSFTSVMRYRDSGRRLAEIAAELGVRYVYEGTYLPLHDRFRLTAQLIEAEPDLHLWADAYERPLDDMLRAQDEVARTIGTTLGRAIGGDAGSGARSVNPAAFEAVLQGRRHRMQLTAQGLDQAVGWFERAIEIDPEYAEAYAGIAGCYCSYGTYGLELRAPHEVLPYGMRLAERAIELDPASVEGHAFLGIMKLKYAWDWPGARAEFERALALNPSDVRALVQTGLYHESLGDFDSATDYAERAYRVDPFNKGVLMNRAWQWHQAGDPHRALGYAEQLAEAEPGFWGGHWVRGHVLRELGRLPEARAVLRTAVDLPGGHTLPLESYGHCCAVAGDAAQARAVLDELAVLAARSYVSPYRRATVLAGLGDEEAMFAALEAAREARSRSLAWLAVAQEFEAWRGSARFQGLLRAVGIPLSDSSA